MNKKNIQKAITYFILICGAIFILLPFVWMIITSVKPSNEVLRMPPTWIPSRIEWKNYVNAFHAVPFFRYFLNSVIVTVCITASELFTTILAAFAFAQLKFKGKNVLFMLLIATMMVPGEILVIPNFVTLANLGWIDTFKALVAPWGASVFSIFLLRQQFMSISPSYYKAAKVDGCNDIRYLFTVMVPMSRPTIVSIALLKIINSWNSYLLAIDCNKYKRNENTSCRAGIFFNGSRNSIQYIDGIFVDDHCTYVDHIFLYSKIYHSRSWKNGSKGIINEVYS